MVDGSARNAQPRYSAHDPLSQAAPEQVVPEWSVRLQPQPDVCVFALAGRRQMFSTNFVCDGSVVASNSLVGASVDACADVGLAVLAVGTAVQANTNYGLLCANPLLLWCGAVAVPAEEKQLKAVRASSSYPLLSWIIR